MHWSGLLTQSLHTGSDAEKEGDNLAVKELRLVGAMPCCGQNTRLEFAVILIGLTTHCHLRKVN